MAEVRMMIIAREISLLSDRDNLRDDATIC